LYCVYDTVDFVFGDPSVRLRDWNLYALHSDPGQKNAVTAQGCEDPTRTPASPSMDERSPAASP
jgi:hypothetical protein